MVDAGVALRVLVGEHFAPDEDVHLTGGRSRSPRRELVEIMQDVALQQERKLPRFVVRKRVQLVPFVHVAEPTLADEQLRLGPAPSLETRPSDVELAL